MKVEKLKRNVPVKMPESYDGKEHRNPVRDNQTPGYPYYRGNTGETNPYGKKAARGSGAARRGDKFGKNG